MLLMIDNYDSFTYNLVQYFGELGEDVRVYRNDEITLDQIGALSPDRICISPGPCTPTEAGVSLGVFERFSGRVPILGVCLGHQAMGQAYGGKVVRARTLMHGKTSPIAHTGVGVFTGLPTPFEATAITRSRSSGPRCRTASKSRRGPSMARSWACATRRCGRGVQFHPESIATSTATRCCATSSCNPAARKDRYVDYTHEALVRCIEHARSSRTRCCRCGAG